MINVNHYCDKKSALQKAHSVYISDLCTNMVFWTHATALVKE